MIKLKEAIAKIPYIEIISSLAKQQGIKVYLVGGFLRDFFLTRKKEFLDFDFCVEKNTEMFLRDFTRVTRTKMIPLDKERKIWRVIIKKRKNISADEVTYTFDFTEFRGESLKEDVGRRDFSINTLCVELNSFPVVKVIDYLQAKEDLEKRTLRVIREEVLIEDPLRILRAFTFLAKYEVKIERATQRLLRKHSKLLANVSGERISEELFKVLSVDNSYKVIKKMSQLYVIDEIIPYLNSMRGVFQGGYHHLDVWAHSLETLRKFEDIYKRRLSKNDDIVNYLNEELAKNRRRIQILKLACLLHDVGKPLAKKEKDKRTVFYRHEKIGRELSEQISERLKLSSREKEVLKQLIFWHMRPGFLADIEQPSARAVYRFFRDTGTEGVGVVILSLSDWRATAGPLVDKRKRQKHEKVMFKIIEQYFADRKKKPLPRLVSGFDIMEKFSLSPSPLIGKILSKIKEEQCLGRIHTKEEAFKIAEKVIAQNQCS